MEYVVSYAQCREDIVLYHVLKDVDKVKWIDVGANDPSFINVTKFFYDRGGNGINIEPLKKYRKAYEENRKRDINLFIGVSDKRGSLTLYGDDTGASFSDLSQKNHGETVVPVERLDNICEKYIKENEEIHFMKIDVEQYERVVLSSANFKKYRPWILIVEAIARGVDNHEEWEKIVLEENYLFACFDGTNRYYVRKESAYLLDKFKDINKLNDLYKIFVYSAYDFHKKKNYEKIIKLFHNRLTGYVLDIWLNRIMHVKIREI